MLILGLLGRRRRISLVPNMRLVTAMDLEADTI